jgi:hypothetical protein
VLGAGLLGVGLAGTVEAAPVTINGKAFELNQFTGASVTYRADGDVDFDGKLWDQAAGVNGYSLGELAAGQYGSDPGDQVSLNSTGVDGPDWLQMNYAGTGLDIFADNELVIYEISSSTSGVDAEGLSFRIQFNGGAWHDASEGVATFVPNGTLANPPAENANQIVFDLEDFGFTPGDKLVTYRIENLDTGSGTSDPDFIFAGVTIPEPASLALLGLGGMALALRRRRA